MPLATSGATPPPHRVLHCPRACGTVRTLSGTPANSACSI